MGVLVSERERCERLYHDNPKDWEDRRYLNRLKKQRQWTESKATMVAEKERKKEEKKHVYIKGKTNESYRMRNGGKLNLPIYYRNKIFTEEEREKLFLDKIEKGIIYVLGTKIDLKTEESR